MSWSLDYFETGDQLCRPTMVCCCSNLSVMSVPIGFFRILTRNLRKSVAGSAVLTVVDLFISRSIFGNRVVGHPDFQNRCLFGSAYVAAQRDAAGECCRNQCCLTAVVFIGGW